MPSSPRASISRNLSFTGTVPTEAQLRGDFSALLALGSRYQIYDPLTTVPAPNNRFQRQPIPGNIIPANRIDPIAHRKLARRLVALHLAVTAHAGGKPPPPGEFVHFGLPAHALSPTVLLVLMQRHFAQHVPELRHMSRP